MEETMSKMMQVRDAHHQVAHSNISKAQAKQKKHYDLKHDVHQVLGLVPWYT